MVRSRWASLALACSMLFLAGCSNWSENGLFSRFRTTGWNRGAAADCDCTDITVAPEGAGPLLVPPDGSTAAPPLAPPPRIVPIPHATPIPYTP